MNEVDMSRLDLNLLKALKCLLEEKSVSRAALRMHVSQSAMSHTLGRLREAFADELLVRAGRGLELTERAITLYQPVCQVLQQVEALFVIDDFVAAEWRQQIVIHCHDFILETYLAERLNRLQAEAPQLSFQLNRLDQGSFDALERGEADLILSAGFSARDQTRQRRCFTDRIVCLMAADHPLAGNPLADARLLFDYPHIGYALLPPAQDPIQQYAERYGLQRDMTLICDALMNQLCLLEQSQRLAFVPQRLAQLASQHRALSWQPLPFETAPLVVKMHWHARHQQHQKFRWLRDNL